MNYKKMTKAELIKRVESLEEEIEDRVSATFDEGYGCGYRAGKYNRFEYLSNYELSDYENVIRFDDAVYLKTGKVI